VKQAFRALNLRAMFTGIVEKKVRVSAIVDGPHFLRLVLPNTWSDIRGGESVAVNGCCLTVAELDTAELQFDVIAETLERTNLGLLRPGDWVNLERSLRIGDRLDGHFVQGHVDGRAILKEIKSSEAEWRLRIAPPADLFRYIIPKGSVTLDGVSLTIAAIHGHEFEVALIPTTLSLTTLGEMSVGWPLNMEADVLSKTIVSLLEMQLADK
jgi:riboflavin synthase